MSDVSALAQEYKTAAELAQGLSRAVIGLVDAGLGY